METTRTAPAYSYGVIALITYLVLVALTDLKWVVISATVLGIVALVAAVLLAVRR